MGNRKKKKNPNKANTTELAISVLRIIEVVGRLAIMIITLIADMDE